MIMNPLVAQESTTLPDSPRVTPIVRLLAAGPFRTIPLGRSNGLLNGEVVTDHDGNHSPLLAGKLLYLQKGNHVLKIEHFEGNGEQELKLMIDQKPVSADMLWHQP